jgi:phenylacetate-coenzyme A ligase PaaK-like adenylate-forming protein
MDQSAFAEGLFPLLGVGQGAVSRIVTIPTSGTTGAARRIAFTSDEQADIIAYLASGMRMLADKGETIAVLFPCDREAGLGQLIGAGIERTGRRFCAYGLPDSDRGFSGLAQTCLAQDVRGMVGFPQHILALARWSEYHGLRLPVRGVLLSSDNVAPSLKREIARIWDAQVFAHYGTTEMGYGGAVECGCGMGQHIRETDLLFEVIDPASGEVLPNGEWGELVFTTLNRRAMPLIRYRTGDRTRLLPGTCACGSVLRRIDVVKGRVDGALPFTLYDLENEVFALPGVLDFAARWEQDGFGTARYRLALDVQLLPGFTLDSDALHDALHDALRDALAPYTASPVWAGTVAISCSNTDEFAPLHLGKRTVRCQID